MIDEHFVLRDVLRELLPDVRRALIGDLTSPAEAWERHRFDYLDVLLDLPDLVPDLLTRIVAASHDGGTGPPEPPARPAHRAAVAAFALGAATGLALRAARGNDAPCMPD